MYNIFDLLKYVMYLNKEILLLCTSFTLRHVLRALTEITIQSTHISPFSKTGQLAKKKYYNLGNNTNPTYCTNDISGWVY